MAASDRTHYDVLGISRDADAAAVRSAWKLHVQAWHPDRFGEELKVEAERQTALINEAYSVLRDSGRRAAYDCRLAADELAARPEPVPRRAASRTAPGTLRPQRQGTAPVGSPMAVASEPLTVGEQFAAMGSDAMRTLRRHPKVVAVVAAVWLLVVGGSIVASAMTQPSMPTPVKATASSASVIADQSQAVDLDELARQAQAEQAAADEALRRMQEEDARLAAQDAAAARDAARADARAAARARKQAKQGGRVIRIMPSAH